LLGETCVACQAGEKQKYKTAKRTDFSSVFYVLHLHSLFLAMIFKDSGLV